MEHGAEGIDSDNVEEDVGDTDIESDNDEAPEKKKKVRVVTDEYVLRKPKSKIVTAWVGLNNKLSPYMENKYVRIATLIFAVYFFILCIEMIGSGFKNLGSGFSDGLIKTMTDPVSALFIGMLATALVQSSSATTSIIVGMVAGGVLPFELAIPAIMGANIGTTVTNTLVSLGHVRRKEEFRRAFAGATCHDMFNIMAVLILFPIEMAFHPIEYIAGGMANSFAGMGGLHFVSPVKMVTKPVVKAIGHGLSAGFSGYMVGIFLIIIGLIGLFLALKIIVSTMRRFMMRRAEVLINKYLFKAPIYAFLLGAGLTAAIQSSSIATSLMVPLVGAGVLTVEKKFPYTMGTNLGTTVTALLAALGIGAVEGLMVAFAHFSFNLIAICIIYPIRKIPIKMALKLGDLGAERKRLVFLYIVGTFYIIPLLYLVITRWF